MAPVASELTRESPLGSEPDEPKEPPEREEKPWLMPEQEPADPASDPEPERSSD
jgi:hypothetical protein